MLRLSTLCVILAVVASQRPYEYNKPEVPFDSNPTKNVDLLILPQGPKHQTSPPLMPQNEENLDSETGSKPNYLSNPYNYLNQQYERPKSPVQNYVDLNYSGPSAPVSFLSQTTQPGPELNNYPEQNYSIYNYQAETDVARPSTLLTADFGSSGLYIGNENDLHEGGEYSSIPGEPDRDYPIFTEIPETSFRCDAQAYPGYYADVEARCQVFHVCANNFTYNFLCPNGTIFSQAVFVCVWWNEFDCNSAPSLYSLNANLYYDYSYVASRSDGNHFPQRVTSASVSYPSATGNIATSAELQKPSVNYPTISELQRQITSFPVNSGYSGSLSSYPGTPQTKELSGHSYTSILMPNQQYSSSTYPSITESENPFAYLVNARPKETPESYSVNSVQQVPFTQNFNSGTSSGYENSFRLQALTNSSSGSRPTGKSALSEKPSFPKNSLVLPVNDYDKRPRNREYLPPRDK